MVNALDSGWNRYGAKLDSWLDSRVDAAHSSDSPSRAGHGIVIHRQIAPMSAHAYRAMTWIVALFIGLPALLTLGVLLYNYWVWYNTPVLRLLTNPGLTFWTVTGYGFVATSILVVFSEKSPYQSESLRTVFTVYYAVIAILTFSMGLELVGMLSTAPPELVEYISASSIAAAAAFAALLLLVVLPFLPESRDYFARRRYFDQTIRRIHRGELSREQARQLALPPPVPPAVVTKPPQMLILYVLATALFAMLLVRNTVQASAVLSAAEAGLATSAAAALPATSPESVIVVSFLVPLIWATIAVLALAGSVVGRTLFTVYLLGVTFFGFWATLDPQAGSYGLGQVFLGSAHPVFTSLSGFAVGVVGSLLLFMLYRPEVSRFYRETFLKENSPERSSDDIEIGLSVLQAQPPAARAHDPRPWTAQPRTQPGDVT
ncbi:hypothetical protein [Dietzia natronolimnaea]|uniref:hypothetical protein n=1 Tax=Dietzia natronolimnaea TaxID=161920 RepID=UPI001140C872|nr:hypothetical protein [Dietzia natronolimnaea]